MFGEVLEYAGMMEQEKAGKGENHDSGIGTCAGEKATTGTKSVKEKNEEEEEEDGDEEDGSGDELLTFPSSGILSPLSKSVEAVVTPLVRLRPEQTLVCLLVFLFFRFSSSFILSGHNVLHDLIFRLTLCVVLTAAGSGPGVQSSSFASCSGGDPHPAS